MIDEFRKLYGRSDGLRVFRAPGRVNLIGEHTDYNLGFVLPVALDRATYVATAPSGDGRIRIFSEHHQEMREWDAARLGALTRQRHWSDYPVGVAHELARAGFDIAPANLLIRSTVPEGSGLSSSAALEVASALAFLNGRPLGPLELARLCQSAEVLFVGMPCGIMDQYISVFGREHAAIRIDCRSLEHDYVPLPEAITFVAVNSMIKHAHAASAYGERVKECAAAVESIRLRFPSVSSLRDVTLLQLESVAHEMVETAARRARHVITENDRLIRFVKASASANLVEMGALMTESHRSLQHDYEVSCAELDFLVDAALSIDGVCGARMTGGGFGGCTITLLRRDALPGFREAIARAYQQRYQLNPEVYDLAPSGAAGEVENLETIPRAP